MCLFIEFSSRTGCHASGISQGLVVMSVTCQQFPHSPNLFHDCGAYVVWPTKNFHPMLLWPLRVLSHMFLARVMSDQCKQMYVGDPMALIIGVSDVLLMYFRKAIKERWCGIGATKFVVETWFQLFLPPRKKHLGKLSE